MARERTSTDNEVQALIEAFRKEWEPGVTITYRRIASVLGFDIEPVKVDDNEPPSVTVERLTKYERTWGRLRSILAALRRKLADERGWTIIAMRNVGLKRLEPFAAVRHAVVEISGGYKRVEAGVKTLDAQPTEAMGAQETRATHAIRVTAHALWEEGQQGLRRVRETLQFSEALVPVARLPRRAGP